MACFLVPMTEAIVVTIVKNVVEKKERKAGIKVNSKTGLSWSRKLSWLNSGLTVKTVFSKNNPPNPLKMGVL